MKIACKIFILQAILIAVYLNKYLGAVRAGFEPAVRF
jgi:hypothetical protein